MNKRRNLELDDEHSREDIATLLREISVTLERAHPTPDDTLGHRIYVRIQGTLKYLGIPALILASILPVYNISKEVRKSLANELLVDTYITYSAELLRDGNTERAEIILNSIDSMERMHPKAHFAKAKIAATQALLKGKKVEEAEDIIKVLIRLADESNYVTGQYGEEYDRYRLVLMLSEVSSARADYIDALSILNKIEDEIQDLPNEIGAIFHLRRGTVLVWQHKHAGAKRELMSAIDLISPSTSSKELQGEIEFQLGKNEQFQHNYDDAIMWYGKAKAKFEKLELPRGQARTLNNLGMIHSSRLYEKRDNNKALKYYYASASLSKEINDDVGVARAQINIAGIKHSQGKLHEALQAYIISLETAKSSKNNYIITISHSNMGKVYGLLGNREKDYYHAQQAFEGYVSLRDMKNIGMQAGEVADAAKSLGNQRDFVIYDYLSFVYRRATNDSKWDHNLKLLSDAESELGAEKFSEYIQAAKDQARTINLRLGDTDINLDIPDKT